MRGSRNNLQLLRRLDFIQSGNVLFDSPEADSDSLTKKVETHLKKSLGYEVAVMIRTVDEIEKIIKQNPFKKVNIDEKVGLYVTFLSEEPAIDLNKLLIDSSDAVANYKILNREVYTLYNRSNVKYPFSNNFVEKKLNVAATTRNWNVVNKIYKLAKE